MGSRHLRADPCWTISRVEWRRAVLLGAHVSIAGGLRNAPLRAAEIAATAVQIFTKQANRWADPSLDAEQVADFQAGMREVGVRFVCAHDSYLINLATADPVLRDRSYDSFRAELERCRELDLDAVVTHPGNATDGDAARGIAQNAELIGRALLEVPGRTRVLLETTAGTGTALGANFEELAARNRCFDFYWYPRSDGAKLRLCNPVGEGMSNVAYGKLDKEQEGWLYEILPKERTDKFEELEYALPREAAVDCFNEVRKRIKAKHRQYVGWRVLFRTVAADDSYLSPFYQRQTVTIALLQNHQLEYQKYFEDMEPILRHFGGRPHWGKKHSLTAEELAPLYPSWERFRQIRREMDPQGIFLNDYLNKIFGL